MVCRPLLFLLLGLGPALATPPEGTLVPPVQGAYLGFRSQITANPWDLNFSWNLGWREMLYTSDAPAFAYNFIGMEFASQCATHEWNIGVRMFIQPTSFLQSSLSYERIGFPFGILSFAGRPDRSEDDIWMESRTLHPVWADMFGWKASLHREIGSLQGRLQASWSRIDIASSHDSLYIPSSDIISRNRDDLIALDASLSYVAETPFLAAVGPAYSYFRSLDHGIERQRAGIWVQAWPFSSRKGEIIRYWTLRSRLDIWTIHPSRQWQPRFELTLGWERNLFQPTP